jgi:hypothetical protein
MVDLKELIKQKMAQAKTTSAPVSATIIPAVIPKPEPIPETKPILAPKIKRERKEKITSEKTEEKLSESDLTILEKQDLKQILLWAYSLSRNWKPKIIAIQYFIDKFHLDQVNLPDKIESFDKILAEKKAKRTAKKKVNSPAK